MQRKKSLLRTPLADITNLFYTKSKSVPSFSAIPIAENTSTCLASRGKKNPKSSSPNSVIMTSKITATPRTYFRSFNSYRIPQLFCSFQQKLYVIFLSVLFIFKFQKLVFFWDKKKMKEILFDMIDLFF